MAGGLPKVDCDFPGGNIVVDSINGDTVSLHQDLRDTEGNWFYWYFRVRGAAGRTLHFKFDGENVMDRTGPVARMNSGGRTYGWRNVIGVRGPAVSLDSGRTWRWLGNENVKGASFSYAIPRNAEEVRFAVAMPYVESNLHEFLNRYRGNPNLTAETLCQTKKGRPVKLLHLGKLDGQPDYRVLLTARHHACETMASYSLEGILAAILADNDDGIWFRTHVEFLVVPFVDTDGVQDGDQGKNRRPHDHNRDYSGESIYSSVRTLREMVPHWSGGRLRFALDMHCPDLRGAEDQNISFIGGRDLQIWKRVERFSSILESVQSGPLVFSSRNNLPYGKSWNTSRNTGTDKTFDMWASELPGIQIATTIEIPYATAGRQPVTPESSRDLGLDIAHALRRYLMGTSRE
jgi:hypothetical protein